MKKENIFICGDIHGELKKLVWTLVVKLELKNISVIVVGDFGVGFGRPNSMNVQYNRIKKRLEENNINLYAVRGNHDDPSYFDGNHDYPRLKFLEDDKIIDICGWTVYPIGGATSTDREARIELNKKDKRLQYWWPGESIKKVSDYPSRSDIIISHTAPISFDPVSVRSSSMSLELYNDIIEERKYLDQVLKEVNFDYWFYGHFHDHFTGSIGNKIYRGLGIDELFELRCENS